MKHDQILPDKPLSGVLAHLLLSYDRQALEALTEALIAAQDTLDGDSDLEDDDLDGSVEDAPEGFDPEQDTAVDDEPCDEPELGWTPDWAIDQTNPLPDLMVIAAAKAAMAPHVRRFRATRCRKTIRDGRTAYEIIDQPVKPLHQFAYRAL